MSCPEALDVVRSCVQISLLFLLYGKKIDFCLTKHYAIKAYGGRGCDSTLSSLRHEVNVGSRVHASDHFFPLRQTPLTPIGYEAARVLQPAGQ